MSVFLAMLIAVPLSLFIQIHFDLFPLEGFLLAAAIGASSVLLVKVVLRKQ